MQDVLSNACGLDCSLVHHDNSLWVMFRAVVMKQWTKNRNTESPKGSP